MKLLLKIAAILLLIAFFLPVSFETVDNDYKILRQEQMSRAALDVSDKYCPKRSCYWPRPDPGVFTQGQGYKQRSGKQEWLCGNRELRGCPDPKPVVNK
jgi:hypothetical protein